MNKNTFGQHMPSLMCSPAGTVRRPDQSWTNTICSWANQYWTNLEPVLNKSWTNTERILTNLTDSFGHHSVMVHIRTYTFIHILVQQNRSWIKNACREGNTESLSQNRKIQVKVVLARTFCVWFIMSNFTSKSLILLSFLGCSMLSTGQDFILAFMESNSPQREPELYISTANPTGAYVTGNTHQYNKTSLLHWKNHILIQVLLSTGWNLQKYLLAWTQRFYSNAKGRSIYWGKFAQSPIQILEPLKLIYNVPLVVGFGIV